MLRGIPLIFELGSLILGVPTLAAMLSYITNPPYRVRIAHNTGGKVVVRIERALRFSATSLPDLNPNDDAFEDKLYEQVTKAEGKVAALNCTRRSLLPRRKSLSARLRTEA